MYECEFLNRPVIVKWSSSTKICTCKIEKVKRIKIIKSQEHIKWIGLFWDTRKVYLNYLIVDDEPWRNY